MRYVCLDIKATGNSRRDRPWEIAAVAFDSKFQATDSLFLQINPEIELSPQAEHDFGVTNENLQHAPPFRKIADQLTAFLSHSEVYCFIRFPWQTILDNALVSCGKKALSGYDVSVQNASRLIRQKLGNDCSALERALSRLEIDTTDTPNDKGALTNALYLLKILPHLGIELPEPDDESTATTNNAGKVRPQAEAVSSESVNVPKPADVPPVTPKPKRTIAPNGRWGNPHYPSENNGWEEYDISELHKRPQQTEEQAANVTEKQNEPYTVVLPSSDHLKSARSFRWSTGVFCVLAVTAVTAFIFYDSDEQGASQPPPDTAPIAEVTGQGGNSNTVTDTKPQREADDSTAPSTPNAQPDTADLLLEDYLDRNVPGWREQNTNRAFLRWLSCYDAKYGMTRQEYLDQAVRLNDQAGVAEIFQAWKRRY